MDPETGKTIIEILKKRDGLPTQVRLADGRLFTVVNIAWGYDMGDEHAHVTTNISPNIDGHSIDFFFTNEVSSLIDPETGAPIFETGPR